jgi:diadenosine tetraphosphate (Ap4A) HIT family hydrolase
VVEHCTGPLGVGTLIVKPLRHCIRVSELTEAEASELGPLLRRVCHAVQSLCEADQVYVCLWSHAGWEPGHIHFVVQPSWDRYRESYPGPGPRVQMSMFEADVRPDEDAIEAFCERARKRLQSTVDV